MIINNSILICLLFCANGFESQLYYWARADDDDDDATLFHSLNLNGITFSVVFYVPWWVGGWPQCWLCMPGGWKINTNYHSIWTGKSWELISKCVPWDDHGWKTVVVVASEFPPRVERKTACLPATRRLRRSRRRVKCGLISVDKTCTK